MTLTKFFQRVPTLVVIGVAGSAAWPIFFPAGEAGATREAVRPPSIMPPDPAGPPLRRNPFLAEHLPGTPPTAGAAPTPTRAPGEAVAWAAGPEERPSGEDGAVAGMKLGGTFVDGRQQHAVIDGRVYARGEQLRGPDRSPLPYVVAEIRKDRAVLRRGRRSFVLAFSDTPRPAAPKGGVAGAGDLAGRDAKGRPAAARPEGVVQARPPGGPAGPPVAMDVILRLLLGAAGPTPGRAAPVGGIDANSLSAGIAALMGQNDNIGRTGGPAPPVAGDWGAGP